MKKGLFIRIVIIIALFIVYYEQIPSLNITYKNSKIEVLQCPFHWDSISRGSAYYDYAPAIMLATRINATTVEPQASLNFNFSKKTDDFYFDISVDKERSEGYKSMNNEIVVPTEKGTYVFDVIGKWRQGEVLYIFKIIVE